MKKLIFAILIVFIAGITFSENAVAQKKDKKEIVVQKQQLEKSRGDNPNIKEGKPEVDEPVPAPPSKGGEKSRGTVCMIDFDNWTGYYVDVYVDGYFKGTLAPWGDGSVTVYSGYTTIYCETAGKTYYWNAEGNCDGYYYYKLK